MVVHTVNKNITWKGKISLFFLSTLLSLNFIFYVAYRASDYFTGSGLNESVIYHVFYGIQGFDISLYLTELIYLTIIVSIVVVALYYIPFRYCKEIKYKRLINISLIIMLVFQPLTNNILTLTGSGLFFRSFVGDLDPELNEDIVIKDKKNIIYIYAESMEGAFLDKSYFPGLLPNLVSLKSKALSFTNIDQVYGTGNTIAGMIASQCGVPLDSHGINTAGEPFMPKLYCLGDILAENGYNLNYMGGAYLEFAGKGNFYKTHGFKSVIGRKELVKTLDDKTYVSKWGIYDDVLFERALDKLQQVSRNEQPFGFFLLTLDTHYPDNQPSRSCKGVQYLDGGDSYLNAVHCSDIKISGFVNKIMQTDIFNNTIIVIASDHLNPNSQIFKDRGITDRRDMLMVLGKDIRPGEIDRLATTLDITPTLLSLLKTPISRNNLGTNLLSTEKTLISEHDEISEMLNGWSFQLKKFN